jgi:hypothetical protein
MNEQRKQERREFNEALRARMRLIAAQRGVADADMKWIGRLKHYHLAEFVRKHQLDWHWYCWAPRKRHHHPCASSKAGGNEAPAPIPEA